MKLFVVLAFFAPQVFAEVFKMEGGQVSVAVDSELRVSIDGSEFLKRETFIGEGAKGYAVQSHTGDGKTKLEVQGVNGTWLKTIRFEIDNGLLRETVRITNSSQGTVQVKGWRLAQEQLKVSQGIAAAFLPGTYESRPDWIRTIKPGFKQKNYLGMNATDYGGGTPFVAAWTKAGGKAVALVDLAASMVSLPIEYSADGLVRMHIESNRSVSLKPGETLTLPSVLWQSFRGDVFEPLRAYSVYMSKQGLRMAPSPMSTIGPIWCAWGYGRNFTVEQVIATLPVAKRLGFEWVGIDDGWQEAIGDWTPNRKKFPNGEADLKKLVQAIHDQGMRAQLWWAPFAVHEKSAYVKAHKDQLLLNKDQSKRKISWWDSWYLCPADREVKKDVATLAKKFIAEWGFDGLKIDGQHLNAAPECFNAKHKHTNPQQAHTEYASAFSSILTAAQSSNEHALVEVCPCGTAFSIYNLPFQNMTVASDPSSSLQVRQKGKVLKALTGDQTVFFGDHVELSRKGMDFASTFAVGGLPGSNFTLAQFNIKPQPSEPDTRLTPAREAHWSKWIPLAKQKRLWLGEYLGDLYDVVFDRPEAHVVRTGARLYYGFFADQFDGEIELRGLKPGQDYSVQDYVEAKSFGSVNGGQPKLKVKFRDYLLLEAIPETVDKSQRKP